MPNRCPLSAEDRKAVLDIYESTKVLTVRDADPTFDGFANPSANVVGETFFVTSVHPQTGRVSTDMNLRHTRFIERIFVGSKAWPQGILAGGFTVESRASADSGEFKMVDRRYDFSHAQLEKLQTLADNRRWIDFDEARRIERAREIKRREAQDAQLDAAGTIQKAVSSASEAIGVAVAKAIAQHSNPRDDGEDEASEAPAPAKRRGRPAAVKAEPVEAGS